MCDWKWSVECVLLSYSVSKMCCNIEDMMWELILKIHVLIQATCAGSTDLNKFLLKDKTYYCKNYTSEKCHSEIYVDSFIMHQLQL